MASTIKLPIGSAPFVLSKLTRVVGVLAYLLEKCSGQSLWFLASLVLWLLGLVSSYTPIGNLEHRAISVRSARLGCAEEVAFGVGDQAGFRKRAVGIVEGDQGGWCACITARGLGDLEHRANSGRSPYWVVPMRLPLASRIRLPNAGPAPLPSLKLLSVVKVWAEAAVFLVPALNRTNTSPPVRLIRPTDFRDVMRFSFRFLRAGPRP